MTAPAGLRTDPEPRRPSPARARPHRGLADRIVGVIGGGLDVAIECFDGSYAGPRDATTTIVVRNPDALRRIVGAPGELGAARAYVAGDLDVVGPIFPVLELAERFAALRRSPRAWIEIARIAAPLGVHRVPPPPEEAHVRGRRHSKHRDRDAISYHYDVSNAFYRLVLGPTMTYSCAVWSNRDVGLDRAQRDKYDLICRKLGLRPGVRLLDVGCGWGGMVMHAAQHYGVQAVGVTISRQQAQHARHAVAEAGLADRVAIRFQDYRDIDAPPFDAISSIGMFEHVGLAHLSDYFDAMARLLVPGGRFLNHGIACRWANGRISPRGFMARYVFPDGELHEVGRVVSRVQHAGLEVRDVENLREHYALTLRAWVQNLERNWDAAVREAGEGRARVWRLYMAACALAFEQGDISVDQVLSVKLDHGRSGMPLRRGW